MLALPFTPHTALAPLEGVGGPAMLAAWARVGGMGLLCAPFLRVTEHLPPPRLVERLCLRHGEMPHSVQLLGRDPARMAAVAAELERRGVDVVDINFGCPARTILRKRAGAALLAEPRRVGAIVQAVRDAVDLPVSAKIRLGVDDPDDALHIAEVIQRSGASFLTVHARTLADRYRAPARWSRVAGVVRAVDLPVLGNGDVWTAADALRLQRETGCAGVMLGRGALRNPWIFHQIESAKAGLPPPWPSLAQIRAFLVDFREALEASVRPRRRISGKMKEIISYLGLLLDDGGAWRRRALRSPDLDALGERLNELTALGEVGLVTGPPTQAVPAPP